MPGQDSTYADLSEDMVKSFQVAKQMCISGRINSIDFSPDGEQLMSADNCEQIIFHNCDRSEQVKTITVRKYGVEMVRFTRQPNHFIHSSTKVDYSIRHMDADSVEYLSYFRGHVNKVVTLCMSPTDDKFISGSLDRTLRLWDLRSARDQECIGCMHLSGRPIAAFDPTGQIFAVGVNSTCIKLYDVAMYEKGPFITFKMDLESQEEWIDLKFSPDGNVIMINTNGSVIRLIDAYDGTLLRTITARQNVTAASIEASFSPDSQYILSGSTDGLLHIWNADTGDKVSALKREKCETIRCVRFNPQYMLLATGDSAVEFWLPTI